MNLYMLLKKIDVKGLFYWQKAVPKTIENVPVLLPHYNTCACLKNEKEMKIK